MLLKTALYRLTYIKIRQTSLEGHIGIINVSKYFHFRLNLSKCDALNLPKRPNSEWLKGNDVVVYAG